MIRIKIIILKLNNSNNESDNNNDYDNNNDENNNTTMPKIMMITIIRIIRIIKIIKVMIITIVIVKLVLPMSESGRHLDPHLHLLSPRSCWNFCASTARQTKALYPLTINSSTNLIAKIYKLFVQVNHE